MNSSHNFVDDLEFTCQYEEKGMICDDKMKLGDITTHLEHKHGITSSSHQHTCRWIGCSVKQSMLKSSLIRHTKEKHIRVRHGCTACKATFSRRRTLSQHVERYHSNAQVEPQTSTFAQHVLPGHHPQAQAHASTSRPFPHP